MYYSNYSKESFISDVSILFISPQEGNGKGKKKEVMQMSSKEGYDVLRLIEHGQSCYISSEYVKGCILAVWLRYHPNLSKDRLLEWIQDITRQLGLIHRCRGNL